MAELSRKHAVILILLLIITFLSTYSRHSTYPYPYHHDEWQHIGISQQIIDEGYNKQFNPFIGAATDHADLEPGFHFLISSFFYMTGLDMVMNYRFLAGFFAALTGIAIFLCIFEITREFFSSIFSIVVFISLKTNVNLLGKEFFVPLVLGIFLLFSFAYFFLRSLREKNERYLFFSGLIAFMMLLTHPPALIIIIIPVIIELINHLDFIKGTRLFHWGVLLFAFTILVIILFVWKGTLHDTKVYISDLLVFEKGWGKLEVTFFIPLLYGLINIALALYGFVKSGLTNRFYFMISFITIGMTAFFNIFSFSILIPYPRAVHYAMAAMVIFTAIGFFEIVKNMKESSRLLMLLLSAIFILNIFNLPLLNYSKHEEYKSYSDMPITREDYDALLYLKDNYGADNVVVTPYFMTSAVYPISGNKAISLIPAVQRGGFMDENLNFWSFDCTRKNEIIHSSGAKFILSRIHLDCTDFKEIYSKGTLLYLVE